MWPATPWSHFPLIHRQGVALACLSDVIISFLRQKQWLGGGGGGGLVAFSSNCRLISLEELQYPVGSDAAVLTAAVSDQLLCYFAISDLKKKNSPLISAWPRRYRDLVAMPRGTTIWATSLLVYDHSVREGSQLALQDPFRWYLKLLRWQNHRMSFMRRVFSLGKEKRNQYYSSKMAWVKLLRHEVIHLREMK